MYERGFTIIETIVVISLIGIMTTAMISSFRSNNNIERFKGDVEQFAKFIQEAQVASFTVQTDGNIPGRQFWRGTNVEINRPGNTFEINLLTGGDLLHQRSQQRRGITNKTPDTLRPVNLANFSFTMTQLCINDVATNSATIAFLAPDGKAYLADRIYANSAALTSAGEPYALTGKLSTLLDSKSTDLEALVTFETTSGTIDVEIGNFTNCSG